MSNEEVLRLERKFGEYMDRWVKGISSWTLDRRVDAVEGGGVGITYHVPYRIGFTEKGGEKYVFVRAGWVGEDLVEAIEGEHDGLADHLERLRKGTKPEDPTKNVDPDRFFNGWEVTKEIPEGGIGFTNVSVRIKEVPDDSELFFKNVMCGVVKPTMRAVDKVKGQGAT